jgi:DNA-binding SARP family transcriptional activator
VAYPQPHIVPARIRVPATRGLRRERLLGALDRLWDHRLALVVAPAGSGKTTLLSQFASALEGPVAWYTADGSHAEPGVFLSHLEQAVCTAFGDVPRGWESEDAAAQSLEGWAGTRGLVVLDDLHALEGTPAEAALERLIDYIPPNVFVLAASRRTPGFNLSRLRVSGALLEVGSDDLRFRSWEVERLFRDIHGEPLTPEDLAALTRGTEGWAAGLQLFHLATRGKPVHESRKILAELRTRSRLVREYLARNVIDELPEALRAFLLDTCVLDRMSGRLCDELLGVSASELVLEELERRQIFTYGLEEGWWRYHEVLRSHLQVQLVQTVGEAEARERYRRAGELLETAGAVREALQAFCRAEDWDAVDRLLGKEGELLADGPDGWLDLVPSDLREDDPWVLLAAARRERARGRWHPAQEAYQKAERAFGGAGAAEICRAERQALTSWMEPAFVPIDTPSGAVRAAVSREPLRAKGSWPGAQGALARGICSLLAGQVLDARPVLLSVGDHPDASPSLVAGARLAAALAAMLAGDPGGERETEAAAEEAEHLGILWLARLSRASLALSDRPDGASEAAAARLAGERRGDQWGTSLAALLEGMGALRIGGSPTAVLDVAVQGFRHLGAGTLEAWARSAHALAVARTGTPEARQTALQAETFARAAMVRGAQMIAFLALAQADPAREGEHRAVAMEIANECGLALPEPPSATQAPSAPFQIWCFGRFSLTIDGKAADLSSLRPRIRRLLRLLAMGAGAPIHREVLTEALWPGADPETGGRNLHVAISTLRRVLEPDLPKGAGSLILREGETYRLALPEDTFVDVLELDDRLVAARGALARKDAETALTEFRRAMAFYVGDLLPEEGPAEWIVGERERRRLDVSELAGALAEALLVAGEPGEAAWVCRRGLQVDRYHDALWRTLVRACDQAGDPVASARAGRDYQALLLELGLPPSSNSQSESDVGVDPDRALNSS